MQGIALRRFSLHHMSSLSPEERSSDWLAVAEGPGGEMKVGRGADPERALADLHERLQAA